MLMSYVSVCYGVGMMCWKDVLVGCVGRNVCDLMLEKVGVSVGCTSLELI